MATGRRPFAGTSSASVISSILRDPPPPFAASRRTLASAHLEALVLRCLAKEPSRRFQSAEELTEALKKIAGGMDLAEPFRASSPLLSSPGPVEIPPAPTFDSLALPTLATVPPEPLVTAPPTPQRPDRLPRWARPLMLAALLAILLAAGLRWLPARPGDPDRKARPAGTRQPLATSSRARAAVGVAVLPLSNLSGDSRQEYFSDGTTEALIGNLAKIGGLRVISRTSVMRFKNSHAPLPEIARELGVSYVLEGSLSRMADQVVITTQLVDAMSDSVVWADRFEGGVQDLFTFQDKVAEQVVHATRIEVTGDDRSRLKAVQAVQPYAYELYLKARFLINQRTPEALLQALGQLQEVLRREPGYAPAWAAEAECYAHLISPALASIPPREGITKARAAALRAIELDGNLSEAHVVLGFVTMESWDWPAAGQELRRAIELGPSNADAHLKYALYLSATGRHAEAIPTIETARKLDPLSPAIRQAMAAVYRFAGAQDRAIEAAKATLELQPDFWIGHFHLGLAYSSKGRYAEADAELRRALLEGPQHFVLAAIGRNDAFWGKPQESRRLLAELEEKRKTTFVAPTSLAKICFALGDTDAGFGWLRKALDERDQGLMFLRSDPDFPPSIHSDPRFKSLLRAVGLDR
jgi:TolB-like protein/Tfp pilus assembly protein PilF